LDDGLGASVWEVKIPTSRKEREKWGTQRFMNSFKEEANMSSKIDPEAGQPTTVQSFEFSNRNPVVMEWGGGGGVIASPSAAESRVTQESAAVSPDAGMEY
jgi:hypothetical protein